MCNNHSRLSIFFSKINEAEIPRETLKLETAKACQDTDIPTKTIKESVEIITDVLLQSFNDSVVKSIFPSSFRKCKCNFQICLKYLSHVIFVNYTVLCLNSKSQ